MSKTPVITMTAREVADTFFDRLTTYGFDAREGLARWQALCLAYSETFDLVRTEKS